MISMSKKRIFITLFVFLILLELVCCSVSAQPEFVLENVFEVSLDLPRIWFLFKRDPNGPPLLYEGYFEPNWAFLDTGASGILLSKETTQFMGIDIDPQAVYVDVGVGGYEFFDVSEPLYFETAGYSVIDPYNTDFYESALFGGRCQVKQYTVEYPEQPLDVLGMPLMAGKVAVFHTGATNIPDILSADIKEPGDPAIPDFDMTIALRFNDYTTPEDSHNIPPLPIAAYNPVIDNVVVKNNFAESTGSWLLDTGGSVSLMSVAQGVALGLTDPNGDPIIATDFVLQIGGIGGEIEIPGFEIDQLRVSTLQGYDLVYKNARIGVHDIGYYDEVKDEVVILDGIFGMNMFSASAIIQGVFPIDISGTVFDYMVVDTPRGVLGLDLLSEYESYIPQCNDPCNPSPAGDVTGDCRVDAEDIKTLAVHWLRNDCNELNSYCTGCDINQDTRVDFIDYSYTAASWMDSVFAVACGSEINPWPEGDLNRDCHIDIYDLTIIAEEWIKTCNWLNWNCSGADANKDTYMNLEDFAEFSRSWQFY